MTTEINMSAPPLLGPSNTGTYGCPERNYDALTEASLPPQPEVTEEAQPFKKIDTGKPDMNKVGTNNAFSMRIHHFS
ncbi:hypothetical protein FS837_010121 [Tulasnella sp. UAMH 9824]|nr:hypothetical protein FS837_010121 [Tulasnella sp. UAMH 9824]